MLINTKKQDSKDLEVSGDASVDTELLLKAFPKGVVVFDLETTGLSSLCDSIIEIGAIKVSPDGSLDHFQTLINPGKPISERSIKIHHITDDMVKEAPKTEESIKKFYEFIEDFDLVAHNAQFDAGFIIFDLHMHSLEPKANSIYCSCLYARRTIRDAANHKLSTLAHKFGIDMNRHHRAYDDALTCLSILQNSLKNDPKLKLLNKAKLYELKQFKKNVVATEDKKMKFLFESSKENTPILIEYNGGTYKNIKRPITPVALMPTPRGNVLYALCLITDNYKSFMLKKIDRYETATQEEVQGLILKLNSPNRS
ncbi:MAG: PolC-type DNA polymerase III [Bacteriovoracaceae bacterium]